MAQFPLLKLTRTGQEMTGMSQGGGKLTFVRVELGDGELKEGDSIETLTALKHGIMQLPLQGYQSEGNGKARLRFIVDNSALAAGFINREIGVFAKIENGAEQLYAYTNAGNYADWIPSKETPIDSDIVDLHIVIGNAPNVVIDTSNGAYAAKIDIEEHNKAPDAHANIRRILDDKAPIASPALTGTPTVPTASKGTSTDQIASTAFVSQAIADADANVSERALKIAILTGTVAGGETIPLPDGYTEDQCKWIVSVRTKQVDDDDTITCHTDEHRVVTCWTYQRGNKGAVNYMIIGVK